jgi:dihydroneopterin aldolase
LQADVTKAAKKRVLEDAVNKPSNIGVSADIILDNILIEGLEFYGFHGVPDAEQTIGHRYIVDARLYVDIRAAAQSDAVGDTVNYAHVAATLLEIGTGAQFRLLERLAEQMAAAVFAQFVPVQGVTLRVRKVLPPMNAIVAAVGVEITRLRE